MRRPQRSRARTCRCPMLTMSSQLRRPFSIGIEIMATKKPKMTWHKGGCHCGAVTYEVLAPSEVELVACNCSICAMTGYQHLIVTKDQFKLLTGKRKLTNYTFETGAAKHL